MKSSPVVAILGPRQSGKTTLAKQAKYDISFDLENPRDLAKLENPQLALEDLTGVILIDEIQRKPELFPLLRFLIDHHPKQKYLILGSASRDLLQQSSESLAGRIHYQYLGGFSLEEVGEKNLRILWLRGGFPRSFLSRSNGDSIHWRENYITTFLERDLPQLGIRIPSQTLRKFWIMLSHYHGQILNYSELGRSFGITDMTVKKYIDILASTFMVRTLQPWHSNIGKRQIKSPKFYLRDSGIFHTLQAIDTQDQLEGHPKLGASWEGFALELAIRSLRISDDRLFFWGTHSGAELDLFWHQGGRNLGLELKYTDAPKLTKSMKSALQDLNLSHLYVIYPGKDSYSIDKKITVLPLSELKQIK